MTSFLPGLLLIALCICNAFHVHQAVAQEASIPIHITRNQCPTITSLLSNHADCSVGEMVVNGGGSCSASSITASAPLSSMQGWRVQCVDGTVPSSVSAQCCQAAADTTQIPNFVRSNKPLTSGSFLRGCVWMTV